MATRKFNVGDKVIISNRCPKELSELLRKNRARTIKGRFYNDERQCTYYHLGYNFRGASSDIEAYPFRSYMLEPAVKGRKTGRPREKRKWRRKVKK